MQNAHVCSFSPFKTTVTATRDIRGQLDRALQEAEALRADNVTFKARANLAEKEKAGLETR